MESLFFLGEDERAALLRHMMQSFQSSYICLWSFSPLPSNCLVFLDGFYDEERIQQPSSSSSGNLATGLFNAYCGSLYYTDYGCSVPGFAFMNNFPYLEMKIDHLIQTTMVTTQTQMQFYQEAGIKTIVFMGCPTGEIELGFSTHHHPQVNLQMEIQSWFPVDLSTQDAAMNQNQLNPTSSSSSFDIPNSCSITEAMVGEELSQVSDLHFPAAIDEDSRKLNEMIMRQRHNQLQIQGNRTTASQMLHVISERRRREKINQSIRILKSLLPKISKKKVKATVLSNTAEYLSYLRSQMGELKRRNLELELQVGIENSGEESSTERVNVEIIAHVSQMLDQARFMDLRVSLSSRKCSLSELIEGVMRFLKEKRNVSLLNVQSNTRIMDSTLLHGLILRLKVEGNESDESGIQEAMRTLVADQPN